MKWNWRLLWQRYLYIIVVCGCLVTPVVATAAPTVSPLVVDLELEARGQATQIITITNPTDRVQRVYATVNTVVLDEVGGIETFTQRSQADNTVTPTSWFEVSRGRIEIQANEEVELPVRVGVHPRAEPGVYHVLVGIGQGRNRAQAEERVLNGQAPGTIFRVHIADDRTAYLQLRDFAADRLVSNVFTSAFGFRVENPSDTPLIPRGEIIVYDSRGKEMTSFMVNEEGVTIAPGETQTFTIPMSNELAWGRNRALLNLTYGDGQRASLSDTIFFYRVSIPIVVGSIVALLIFSMLVSYFIHRRYGVASAVADKVDMVPVFHRNHHTRAETEFDVKLQSSHEKPPPA